MFWKFNDFHSITRTCGGDPARPKDLSLSNRYYPHMRGWSFRFSCCDFLSFVLPAHAGVILARATPYLIVNRITRTCGGDPITYSDFFTKNRYYPHMRGWSSISKVFLYTINVLPAHAGVILKNKTQSVNLGCITRTCGGDPKPSMSECFIKSYYPHMRGWS